MKNLLVRLFGFSATVIHGDTLVLDRWLWLRKRLFASSSEAVSLIDVGCGSGAFTIGAALSGRRALGLSWDRRNQAIATQRATICRARLASFQVCDLRQLDETPGLHGQFDVAICLETIEHILDDRRLMRAISKCLKAGGRLLLTTPSIHYRPITKQDLGPWSEFEDGGHVRQGYSEDMLTALCETAGFRVTSFSTCSGFTSQKTTALFRHLVRVHPLLGWLAILPLRIIPPFVDPYIRRFAGWPEFSICLEAVKNCGPEIE